VLSSAARVSGGVFSPQPDAIKITATQPHGTSLDLFARSQRSPIDKTSWYKNIYAVDFSLREEVSQRRELKSINFRLLDICDPKAFAYVQITERSMLLTFVLPVSAIAI
jgi:hypothetical protein